MVMLQSLAPALSEVVSFPRPTRKSQNKLSADQGDVGTITYIPLSVEGHGDRVAG